MIFLDNASTTKPYKQVINEVTSVNENLFFNPSSLYVPAIKINTSINEKRNQIIKNLGGNFFDTFIFLSGASEANNFALRGVLKRGGKLVTTMGEHPSVYNTAKQLQNEGWQVEFVNLTSEGLVDIQDYKQKLQGATVVSVIHVSNETGAINDIKNLCTIAKQANPKLIFHSDGVQAFGKINVNVSDLGVDLYTISGHKIHAPKGVGGLYIKKGVNIKPLIYGGEHEQGLRAGTQNVSGIYGLAMAANLIIAEQNNNYKIVENLHNYLLKKLQEECEFASVVNNFKNSSPYITVIAVKKLRAETLLHLLEENEIYVGNGSACSSRYTDNRILSAMGVDSELVRSAIRISLNETNTTQEIDEFVKTLQKVVQNYFKKIK